VRLDKAKRVFGENSLRLKASWRRLREIRNIMAGAEQHKSAMAKAERAETP